MFHTNPGDTGWVSITEQTPTAASQPEEEEASSTGIQTLSLQKRALSAHQAQSTFKLQPKPEPLKTDAREEAESSQLDFAVTADWELDLSSATPPHLVE